MVLLVLATLKENPTWSGLPMAVADLVFAVITVRSRLGESALDGGRPARRRIGRHQPRLAREGCRQRLLKVRYGWADKSSVNGVCIREGFARGSQVVAAMAAVAAIFPATGSAANDVFVADPGSNRVVRVDTSTSAQQEVAVNGSLVDPMGVAVASDGTLIVADASAFGGNGGVIRVNPTTGAQSTLSSGGSFKEPNGVAIAANGDIFVADADALGGNGAVIRVNPTTGAQSTLSSGGLFKDPKGVTTASNGDIWVADSYGNGTVIRINPSNGAQTSIATGSPMVDPTGITADGSGRIVVADPAAVGGAGALIDVNRSSGAQSVISGAGSMQDPTGVVLQGELLLAADENAFSGLGAVLRVNLAGGAQSVVSMANLLTDPHGLGLPPDRDSDAIPDYSDNCPDQSNPAQEDTDADGIGDACDPVDNRQSPALPAPVLGKSVNVAPVSGVVRVSVPTASARALEFEVLTGERQIPVGSQIDTTRGRLRLTSATSSGATQTADFYDGLFKIGQITKGRSRGLTDLTLTGKMPSCRPRTSMAARRTKRRRLWGDGKGRFRTRGRRSSASVRGTKWLVEDRCAGTLTRVARGTVKVNDYARKRKVTLHAGDRYLARKPQG